MNKKLEESSEQAATEYTDANWRGKWGLRDSMEAAFMAGVNHGAQWCLNVIKDEMEKRDANTTNNTQSTNTED